MRDKDLGRSVKFAKRMIEQPTRDPYGGDKVQWSLIRYVVDSFYRLSRPCPHCGRPGAYVVEDGPPEEKAVPGAAAINRKDKA